MPTTEDIARLIERLAKLRGWSVVRASKEVTGSGGTVKQWRTGTGVTLSRASAIIACCSDEWPVDHAAEWPTAIPRPEPREAA
ncbi:MAG: hypothetical protein ACU0CI_01565 [Shimia sp.]